jgi:hypothetical protein
MMPSMKEENTLLRQFETVVREAVEPVVRRAGFDRNPEMAVPRISGSACPTRW